jgi:hypothetical protein
MTATSDRSPWERCVPLGAVRDLIAAARSERATASPHSRVHEFYLGVEAAAEEVLRPEAARSAEQLGLESSSFQDGYLETSNLLATALAASEPPLRLTVPDADALREGGGTGRA